MIYRYSNDIYPLDLFVGTMEDINKAERTFYFYHTIEDLRINNPIENARLGELASTSGVTYVVKHKKSNDNGILIILNMEVLKEGDYQFILDTVSHESSHAVDATYQMIHQDSEDYDSGNEPHAYLTGWYAGCIGSYLTEYFKKNGRKEI